MTTAEHPEDRFFRTAFLKSLTANIDALAKVKSEVLATPRVITVGGEWGSGKTWIASELEKRLRAEEGRRIVSIDVFRYDHHDDPFSVIASSIYSELKPSEPQKKKFFKAAGAVMKSAAPIAMKAALSVGMKAIGITDEAKDEIAKQVTDASSEAAGKLSEKAIESLFDSYAKTQEAQETFIETLGELTASLAKPLVVLVDELDRCRPSFTLELLERVKHIFSADNIVFVLFCNPASIHESIRHTYGQGTDAERYLSKFVALDLPLLLPEINRPSELFDQFINALTEQFVTASVSYDFRSGLRIAARILQPTLRDLQKAIQVWAQTECYKTDQWTELTAYLLLLKVISPSRFQALRAQDQQAASRELSLFTAAGAASDPSSLSMLHATIWFIAERERLSPLLRTQIGAGQNVQMSPWDQAILHESDRGRMVPILLNHAARLTQPMA